MYKFRLVTKDTDNCFSSVEFVFNAESELVANQKFVIAMDKLGHKLKGYNSNPKQRSELQGAPLFYGLYGAMFDGDAIRYEDKETYETLSA